MSTRKASQAFHHGFTHGLAREPRTIVLDVTDTERTDWR